MKGRRENNILIAGKPTGTFNWLSGLHAARGEYISVIEGDDFFVSRLAMKSRLEVLKNDGYSAVWGRTGSESSVHNEGLLVIKSQDLMFESSCVATSGLMFKRDELDARDLIPFLGCMVQDVVLFHALLSNGRKGLVIGDITSHYRLHGESMWWSSGGEMKKREMLKVWLLLAGHYGWYGKHPDAEKVNRWISSVLQLPSSSSWRDDFSMILGGLVGLWTRVKSIS